MIGKGRQGLCLLLCLILSSVASTASGQELRAEVEIQADGLGASVDRGLLASLRQQLYELLNRTSWASISYTEPERIEAQFSLQLRELTPDGRWQGDLVVSARRPVYHSDYKTTVFLWRDRELSFTYQSGERLLFQGRETQHPLVMLLAYYVHLILASELDSFSPLRGTLLEPALQELAQEARSHSDWPGWVTEGKGRERLALLEHFSAPDDVPLRQAWYHYHRLGLDLLADSLPEGKTNVLNALTQLRDHTRQSGYSPWMTLVEDSKQTEVINLFKSATSEQKSSARTLLQDLFPSSQGHLQALQ